MQDDLVSLDITAGGPNRLWPTDVTEHKTTKGMLNFCAIKDGSSERIVGSSTGSRMKAWMAVQTLQNTVACRGYVARCIAPPDSQSQGVHGSSSTF